METEYFAADISTLYLLSVVSVWWSYRQAGSESVRVRPTACFLSDFAIPARH